MRRTGFEPVQALSYHGLNVVRLTAPASPHKKERKRLFLKICFRGIMENLPNLVTIYPKFSNKTIYNRVTQSSKLSITCLF